MFCPNCKYEYVLGVAKCPDCGADLVYSLPPKPQEPPIGREMEPELVEVFKSTNLANFGLAKSILDDAGIVYISRGGRTGFGPAVLIVNIDDAEKARELLAGFE